MHMKKPSRISPDDYAALLERVSGLELALSALAADNASLALELERERASRGEEVARAVEAAVAAVRAELQAVIA